MASKDTGDRFHEGGLLEADGVGQHEHSPVDVYRRHSRELGQAAGVDIGVVQSLAGRFVTPMAVVAGVAGDVVRHGNAVARFVALDALPHLRYHPPDLVTQDEWGAVNAIPLHDVAAAQAASLDAHE